MDQVWSVVSRMYQPWLTPLSASDKEGVAQWIKELSADNQVLLPWAPGDSKKAASMLSSFSTVISYVEAILPGYYTAY